MKLCTICGELVREYEGHCENCGNEALLTIEQASDIINQCKTNEEILTKILSEEEDGEDW